MKIISKIVLIFIFVMIAFVLGVSIANAKLIKVQQKPSLTCERVITNGLAASVKRCFNDEVICYIYDSESLLGAVEGSGISCIKR